MDYFDAIKQLAAEQGVTLSRLCEQAGHANSYIASYINHGRVPTLTTAAKLAAPLGYGLALVPLDADPDALDAMGAVPVDAPQRTQQP